MPKDFSRQISEKEIHLHAWQWVQKTYPDLLIFHVPNGEDRSIQVALKLKRMGVLPGVADFLLFSPRLSTAIELKEKGGTQSKAQKLFQKRWEACGHSYVVLHSLDEFQNLIRQHADLGGHFSVWPWKSDNQNP